jgi:FkbM family methyltransferase
MHSLSQRFHHRSLLGKLLRMPLHLIPHGTTVTVRSGVNKGFRWVVGGGTHGCWLGFYERDKQLALQSVARPGMVAFDLGANVGFYTLALSRLVGEKGRVFAFEPDSRNVIFLRRHVLINRLTNAAIVQAVVADGGGLVGFKSGGTGETGHVETSSNYLVPAVGLDSLVNAGHIPRPDIVKMDVEGAETTVLRGACELLDRRQTIWLIALHGDEAKETCFRLLLNAGYRLQDLFGARVNDSFHGDEIVALPG